MIRNLTYGEEVHEACVDLAQVLGTVCGVKPLSADTWMFTNDEVTCEECKQ